MLSDCVKSFYRENGYLEYDAIEKRSISELKQFIRKQFANEELRFLKHCVVNSKLIDPTVQKSLKECAANKSYVDLATILPAKMPKKDIEELYNAIQSQKNAVDGSFVLLKNIGRYFVWVCWQF